MSERKFILSSVRNLEVKERSDKRFSGREETMSKLLQRMSLEQSLGASLVHKMVNQLSGEEVERGLGGVTVMRVNALFEDGKVLPAIHTLLAALREQPESLMLQSYIEPTLNRAHRYLMNTAADDLSNPLIAPLFETLYRLGYVNFETALLYAQHLIINHKFNEAEEMILKLIKVVPNLLGLSSAVEEVAGNTLNPVLFQYLQNIRAAKPRFDWIHRRHSPKKVEKALVLFNQSRDTFGGEAFDEDMEKKVDEFIKSDYENRVLDLSLRELYFIKAICLEKNGRYMKAFELFQELVLADPYSAHVYRSYNIERDILARDFVDQKSSEIKPAQTIEVFNCLIESGSVSFRTIKNAALAFVSVGETHRAKEMMNDLINFNRLDIDFNRAALEVASEAKDEAWLEQIISNFELIKKETPWDLKLYVEGEGFYFIA